MGLTARSKALDSARRVADPWGRHPLRNHPGVYSASWHNHEECISLTEGVIEFRSKTEPHQTNNLFQLCQEGDELLSH